MLDEGKGAGLPLCQLISEYKNTCAIVNHYRFIALSSIFISRKKKNDILVFIKSTIVEVDINNWGRALVLHAKAKKDGGKTDEKM